MTALSPGLRPCSAPPLLPEWRISIHRPGKSDCAGAVTYCSNLSKYRNGIFCSNQSGGAQISTAGSELWATSRGDCSTGAESAEPAEFNRGEMVYEKNLYMRANLNCTTK